MAGYRVKLIEKELNFFVELISQLERLVFVENDTLLQEGMSKDIRFVNRRSISLKRAFHQDYQYFCSVNFSPELLVVQLERGQKSLSSAFHNPW